VPVSLTGQFMRGFGEEQTRQAAAKPDLIKTVEELKKMGIDPATSLEMLSRSAYSTEPDLMLEIRELATKNDPGVRSIVEQLILGDGYILLEEGGKKKLSVAKLNSILTDPGLGIKSRTNLIAHLLNNGYIRDVSDVVETTGAGGEGSDEERLGSKIKAFFKKPPSAQGIG